MEKPRLRSDILSAPNATRPWNSCPQTLFSPKKGENARPPHGDEKIWRQSLDFLGKICENDRGQVAKK